MGILGGIVHALVPEKYRGEAEGVLAIGEFTIGDYGDAAADALLATSDIVKEVRTASSSPSSPQPPASSAVTQGAAPDPSKMTAGAFFAMRDVDLMNAVRNGKIPDSVSKDPAQMQALQMRMNDISQMNQLITQMIAAMHDMAKAVINNVRA